MSTWHTTRSPLHASSRVRWSGSTASPSGTGKTTTIRLLLDLVSPDAGTVELFGLDARRDSVAIRRRIGYVPGDLALYDRLTARELLGHFAHLRARSFAK